MKGSPFARHFLLAVLGLAISVHASAGEIHSTLPGNTDPDKHYLFFMHGKIIEKKGNPARSRKYGLYKYDSMLKRFAKAGFEVISEERSKGTRMREYAPQVAENVQQLLAAGVPADHITVSGFSKGGRMTLMVATRLSNNDVNYVVLAGCRTSDISELELAPAGRILSIYDSRDDSFESCADIFAAGNEGLVSDEIVLTIGDGHGVFYKPLDEWVEPFVKWAINQTVH